MNTQLSESLYFPITSQFNKMVYSGINMMYIQRTFVGSKNPLLRWYKNTNKNEQKVWKSGF